MSQPESTYETLFIQSRKRRYVRIVFLLISANMLLYYFYQSKNDSLLYFAFVLLFAIFIELLAHISTSIQVTSKTLLVTTKSFLGLLKKSYEIPLTTIQTKHFEKKEFDTNQLLWNTFWEIILPTNTSYFVVHTTEGRSHKIALNVSDSEAEKLLNRLPDRIPNG